MDVFTGPPVLLSLTHLLAARALILNGDIRLQLCCLRILRFFANHVITAPPHHYFTTFSQAFPPNTTSTSTSHFRRKHQIHQHSSKLPVQHQGHLRDRRVSSRRQHVPRRQAGKSSSGLVALSQGSSSGPSHGRPRRPQGRRKIHHNELGSTVR
jgi:hypothetical protein